jgi:hypothetical protein
MCVCLYTRICYVLGLSFTRPWIFHVSICRSFAGLWYFECTISLCVYVVGITQISVKSLDLHHSQHHNRVKHHINRDVESTSSKTV